MNGVNKKREKFHKIQTLLFSGDELERKQACVDALAFIEEIADVELKNEIRSTIVGYLLDFEFFAEAQSCIDEMKTSAHYRIRTAAYFHQIEFWKKKNNIQKIEDACKDAISLAIENQDLIGIAISNLEYAKFLYLTKKYEQCITILGEVSYYAHEVRHIAVELAAKYYSALASQKMGHENVALEFLREVSEQACDMGNQNLAMISEVKRATILMKKGRSEEVSNILIQWCENFETQI